MTSEDTAAILGKTNLWTAELRERGQLDDAAAAHLRETLVESFGERLDHQDDPLLVVMLCGPTAVGKSTLINALAGADIARPGLGATTRAAMLYVHEQDDPARLFEYSHALGRKDQQDTEIVRHHRDELLHKVLVDTPDIDSVRLEHKELTARLVHAADLVLFVTSPEKYKVMRSARWVLQQRQQRAIAFVLNKWDRETLGLQRDRRQELLEDFRHVLDEEGFPDALIFKLSALTPAVLAPAPLVSAADSPGGMENELPALRSWLELGITQSTANMIRQRRLRAAWGRLAAAIESASPDTLSSHPALAELTNRLADGGATAEQRVSADASILEPVGLEDNGWPATPGLLGMWARTRQRVASTAGALRMGFSVLSLARPGTPSAEAPYRIQSGTAFGATGAAVLAEAVRHVVKDAAAVRIALGPVTTAWLAETARLERELIQVPPDVANDLMTAARRLTFRRAAGIGGIYAIETLIVAVLLIAVGRIGLDFIAGTYAPVSLFMTVVELVAMLLFIGNIVANMFFPPLRQRMRRLVAQRARTLVRSTMQRVQAILRDHVEAVDRLAREGGELLRSIDRAVISLTLPGAEEAGVNRLFGQPERLRLEAASPIRPTQLPDSIPIPERVPKPEHVPNPEPMAAETRQPVTRRPTFD